MGCSISKELVERPSSKSRKEAWEAVLARGLAVQFDNRFKRMNGGYIAAIFSANYATTLRHTAPFKALHRDDLLLCHNLPIFADYPQSKASKSGVNGRAQKMALLEIEPVPSLDKLKEPLTTRKLIGGAEVELELIDTWELMEDLNEHEDSLNVESLHVNDDPTFITNRSRSTTSLFTRPSHDTPPSMISSTTAFTALMPMSKSRTSSQGTEDVDVVLTPEESLCAVLHGVNEVKELSRRKLFNKMYQADIAFEDGGLPTCRFTCETTSNTEFQPISSGDERSDWKPLNIQTALSMKYILNDNTSEKDELHFSVVSDATCQLNEANSRESDEENPVFPRTSLSCDSEFSSSSSSPEFSATASLKDWLPCDSPPFTLTGSINGGFDTSISEAIQASHILLAPQMTAYILPNTRRVLSKYISGGEFDNASPKALQSSVEANMLTFKVESCGAHTFDIEGMDYSDMLTRKEQA